MTTTKPVPESSDLPEADVAPKAEARGGARGSKHRREGQVTREQTQCPVCGSAGVSFGLVCQTLSGRPQHFLLCPACELQFDQNPESFEYGKGYYIDNPLMDQKLYLEKGASLRLFAYFVLQTERALLLTRRAVRRKPNKVKLWEAGCGPGLLLDVAQFLGWDALGVEPAPEAARWGQEELNLNIIAKPLRKKPPVTNADVVISSEVIEHLESPWEFMATLSKSLNPEGVLLLTTPNAKSRALAEQGSRWVHLGMGYHLVLYSPKAIETLLRKVGFRSIEIGTFEGTNADERLIVLATKKKIPQSTLKAVSSLLFEQDREAIELTTRYLWHVLRRFEHEKNTYWQGAFFRLVEALVAAGEYGQATEVANQLERFLHSQGWTRESVLETLEEALRRNDRKTFYAKVPTFIGNFHCLRGLARLHCNQLPGALEDLQLAYSIMSKLEQLPYKAYEELVALPVSVQTLFHVGLALLRLGQSEEAMTAFEKVLSRGDLPSDTAAHVRLNKADALLRLGQHTQALEELQQVIRLGGSEKLDRDLIWQANQKTLEINLEMQGRELTQTRQALAETHQALAETRSRLEAQSQQAKSQQITLQAMEGMRRALETQVERALAESVELRAALNEEQVGRRAAELELKQPRFRLVDALNTFVKSKAPGLHRLAKGMAQRALQRRHESKKKSLTLKTLAVRNSPALPARQPSARPLPRLRADLAGCTIIAKNDLCKARVLASSFHQYHPEAPFFVLVVDPIAGYFDPTRENFHVLEATQLEIPNPQRFFFQYDLLEASTAVKPYFLARLLRRHDIEKLVYLDSDILVTNSFKRLSELLERHAIVLTPHLTTPYEDGFKPSELDILQAGSFNLGFVAVRNCETTHRMLHWWQQRLYDQCLMDHERGMHVDQKWMDLAPGLFGDVGVLRDSGYNIAYWNLHDRKIGLRDGRIEVNGEPAYFFHFSGFDPDNLEMVSVHQNRFRLGDLGDVRLLFEHYRELVMAAGWRETKAWPYGWGNFDDGTRIAPLMRRLYLAQGQARANFGDPFSTAEPGTFSGWLKEAIGESKDPAHAITRIWYEIYRQRPDLQEAYPDVLGAHRRSFLQWIRRSGSHEYDIAPQFASCERASPPPLRPDASSTTKTTVADPEVPTRPERGLGVNVAGYVHSEKGVGEAMRAGLRALEAANIAYVINGVEDSGSVNIENCPIQVSHDNPYGINLIYVNADAVPGFVQAKDGYLHDRYNIGCWNWELSSFPSEWRKSFGPLNEVWVPSNFALECISAVSPIPVFRVPYSVDPDPKTSPELGRAHVGLSADRFVFLYVFDFHSYAERKNPLGLVQAFKTAFGDQHDVELLIKCSHSSFAPRTLALLRQACSASNIKLFDGVLAREAVYGLMAICDCYVSLHRSEGFGLTLAETMNLGKPVIATAYSGNMDFMTPSNSFLVRYRLAEIEKDHGPYKKGYVWAEPDLDDAAQLMRRVYEDRSEAAAVGQRARQDIRQLLCPTAVAGIMRERLSCVAGDRLVGAG